jgi:hypothetical protein
MFSAGYKLSARNVFQKPYIPEKKRIRDRKGMRDRIGRTGMWDSMLDMMGRRSSRGLKARPANSVNASSESSIDEPLRKRFMIINPPMYISMECFKILTGYYT